MTIKSMWCPLKDTLKNVVTKYQDKDNANEELDKLSKCKTNEECINRMVIILEEEYIGAKKICEWFVEVLEDDVMKTTFASEKVDDAKRCELIDKINKKILELDKGPVSSK